MKIQLEESIAMQQYSPNCSGPGGDGEVFKRHNDSVLCCSIDSRNRIAVSGGIDDTAFVWDIKTKHVIFECQGHRESVVAAAFSANSTYVATGDLNGHIQARNTTTGNKVFEYDIDEINWILWHDSSEFVLLAGTTKGDFWMWNINDPAAVKTFPSYGHACTAAKLLPDGINIIVSYGDGSVRMFDLKTKQSTFHYSDPTKAEIICLDVNPVKALLAVGCLDSTVKLITCGNFKPIGILKCSVPEKGAKNSHSADQSRLTYDNEKLETDSDIKDTTVSSDDNDHMNTEPNPSEQTDLEVIDEYTQELKKETHEDVICGNDYIDDDDDDDEGEGLDCSDDEFEVEENNVVGVESVLFSPCGNYIASANNSGSIYFWDVSSQTTRCELHTGIGITRCVWSNKSNFITACLDGCIRIYDISLNKLNEIRLHSDQILDIAYQEEVLVTASEDKTCRAIRLLE